MKKYFLNFNSYLKRIKHYYEFKCDHLTSITMIKINLSCCFFFFTHLFYSQNQVVVSAVSEFEGEVIRIVSDTLKLKVYYNLTGNESVGDVVLNVIALHNDGRETRKEFEVIEYKKNNSVTEVTVKENEIPVKYFFIYSENVIITKQDGEAFLWEGDIIF